ncbi:MAG: replicative DNA helicase [Melioribacteraceae bacterium]|nr:MAG: replicative DNA helicase [Melioribacteraceae bacterium]
MESENNYEINQLRSQSRAIPAAVEVEAKVLGAMLLDDKAVPRAFEILKAEYFYNKKHKLVFDAIRVLYEAGEPVDTVSIYEELKKAGKLEEAGGPSFIGQLSQDISSAANVDYHSRVVLEKWILRKLISTSMEVAESAYAGSEDVFDLLDEAESKIFGISQESLKETFTPMDKAVREALELIEAMHSQKMENISVPSGLFSLDNMLGGFQRSDLVIIAARPSMGKTAFALSFARNAAIDHNVPIAVFSLEMATVQLVTRLISAEAKINAHSIRTGKFRAEEGAKISRTVHKLSSAPIYIDDTPGQTVLEVRAKARRLKAEKDIGMIVIDYLQLMNSSTKMESREREISTISRSLKALAKELNIPVIALSQLNRSVESTSDKRPMLSHLRESGAIEQDADVVIFLYRPEVYGITQYPDGMSTEGVAEVIIGKQRNGPVGDVRVKFIKDYARFENLELNYDNVPEAAQTGDDMEGYGEEDDFPI